MATHQINGLKASTADDYTELDRLADRCAQLEHNSRDAAARITRLEADLNECRDFLEGQVDVVDGSYGEPSPNRAMQLVSMIDETLHGLPY